MTLDAAEFLFHVPWKYTTYIWTGCTCKIKATLVISLIKEERSTNK